MPLSGSARSDSISIRRPRPYPVWRRRNSRVSASMSIARPAGTPSMIVTSALPCDSPAVKKRSIRGSFYPKYLRSPDGDPAVGRAIVAGRRFAPRPGMPLVADRFAVHEDGRAFDLPTGSRVTITIGSAGGVSEQLRWTARCEQLRTLRHHAIAPLVDFGPLGETSRFEAWGCGAVVRGRDQGKEVHARAARWLRACGLTADPLLANAVRIGSTQRGVWIPETGSGYPDEEFRIADFRLQIGECGLQIAASAVLPALAEMFGDERGGRPRVSALWGPAGAGKSTIAGDLARVARLRGYIPVAASLIASRQAVLWRGRSLFVIADEDREDSWSAFLSLAIKEP